MLAIVQGLYDNVTLQVHFLSYLVENSRSYNVILHYWEERVIPIYKMQR